MKTLREYIDILDEINRRDFLKGAAGAAGAATLGAMGLKPAPAAAQATTAQTAGPSQEILDRARELYSGIIANAGGPRTWFRTEFDPNDKNYLIFNGKRYKIQQATPDINAKPPANAQWAMTPFPAGRSGRLLGLFMPNGTVYITGYAASMWSAEPQANISTQQSTPDRAARIRELEAELARLRSQQ